jgi:hypothetical protein
MIIGSYYLGKKAKQAYRKRQAEKAAKQLTGPIEVIDPSDELDIKAPPVSPIASPSSVYSEASGFGSSDYSPVTHRSTLSTSSTRDSPHEQSATTDVLGEFAHFEKRGLPAGEASDPPSYDVAVNSPAGHASMPSGDSTAQLHSAYIPVSPEHTLHDGCPTCMALLHQHHHHQHHSAYRPVDAQASGYPGMAMPSRAAELPDPSVFRHGVRSYTIQSLVEMPDQSTLGDTPVELPVAMEGLRLSRKTSAAGHTNSEGESAELPATKYNDSEDRVDKSGEWKAAGPINVQ